MRKLLSIGALACISLFIGNAALTQPTKPPKKYDLFGEFGGGFWKYGSISAPKPLGKMEDVIKFQYFLENYADKGIDNTHIKMRRNPNLSEPHIWKCIAPAPCSIPGDNTYQLPNIAYLQFHPGPDGQYSVARWDAPETRACYLDFHFRSLKTDGISVDVYVVHTTQIKQQNSWVLQRKIVWSDILAGDRQNADSVEDPSKTGNEKFLKLGVRAGDTVDFLVGYGPNKSYVGDIAGLRATIICMD